MKSNRPYVQLDPAVIEQARQMDLLSYLQRYAPDKLKLNGGDINAVQGDSEHSQINMVTDVYYHIIDEYRRKKAELFEDAFYEKKVVNPDMREAMAQQRTQ